MAAEGEEKPAEATLKLVSAEGHIFIVHKKAAIISQTIKSMIEEGAFVEAKEGCINFREISTPILEKVCQYWYYKLKFANVTSEIPEFKIEPEMALELLMAANFLDT
uniref:Elongin-C n=1 Tax=Paramoeba aestuarina TaxID=180227 RepID=A0A7S4PG39_9EUKA